jgi:hypothetical protein
MTLGPHLEVVPSLVEVEVAVRAYPMFGVSGVVDQ